MKTEIKAKRNISESYSSRDFIKTWLKSIEEWQKIFLWALY